MPRHLLPAFVEVVEQAPDAIVLVDPDGLVVYANPRVRDLFGIDRDALIGQRVEMLIPPRLREHHLTHRQRYSREPRVRAICNELIDAFIDQPSVDAAAPASTRELNDRRLTVLPLIRVIVSLPMWL